MFKVSRRADYAVRIMIELGKSDSGQRVPAHEIERQTDVPKQFLYKIAADLAQSGLVQSFAGRNGGLTLSRPAADITMRQIIESIEGPICLNVCLTRPSECPRDTYCPGHGFWAGVQANLTSMLDEAKLSDLVQEALAPSPANREAIVYVYD